MLFSKLSRTTFSDKNFRQLASVWTRNLWLCIVASPRNTSLPGLLMLSLDELLADLAWEPELGDRARVQLEASMQELQDKGWLRYHSETGMLLAPRLLEINIPANPNIMVHWRHLIAEMPRTFLTHTWSRLARRKFRELDRAAIDRMEGRAWRESALERFLADMDSCYSAPLEFDAEDDRFWNESLNKDSDLRGLSLVQSSLRGLDASPPCVSKRKQQEPELPALVIPDRASQEMPLAENQAQPDPMALFSTAFERGADVVTPHREPATTPTGSATAESQRKPRVKSDIKERVSRDCCRLVDFFLKRLQHDKPDAKLPTGETLNAWYDDMDRMLRIDEREVNQIGMLIQWVTQDEFEKANVRCPRKLRQRFDQLELKKEAWEAKQDRISNPPPSNGGYRDRREEPAYPPCFGDIPLRPYEGNTDEERVEIKRRTEIQMQLKQEHEESILRGRREREEQERIELEEARKYWTEMRVLEATYVKQVKDILKKETEAHEAALRELASNGVDIDPKTDEQKEALKFVLLRREMRHLRTRLVAGGFIDASSPAIEEDETKTKDEIENEFCVLLREKAKENRAIYSSVGLPKDHTEAMKRALKKLPDLQAMH